MLTTSFKTSKISVDFKISNYVISSSFNTNGFVINSNFDLRPITKPLIKINVIRPNGMKLTISLKKDISIKTDLRLGLEHRTWEKSKIILDDIKVNSVYSFFSFII